MKKSLFVILLLMITCICVTSYAESYPYVQYDTISTSLGDFTIIRAKHADSYITYTGSKKSSSSNKTIKAEAGFEYYLVYANIINTTADTINYADQNLSVKIVTSDGTEYLGSYGQIDLDRSAGSGFQPRDAIIPRDSEFAIDSWYEGHYLFYCAVPEEVVSGKDTLYMVVEIKNIPFTYYLRGKPEVAAVTAAPVVATPVPTAEPVVVTPTPAPVVSAPTAVPVVAATSEYPLADYEGFYAYVTSKGIQLPATYEELVALYGTEERYWQVDDLYLQLINISEPGMDEYMEVIVSCCYRIPNTYETLCVGLRPGFPHGYIYYSVADVSTENMELIAHVVFDVDTHQLKFVQFDYEGYEGYAYFDGDDLIPYIHCYPYPSWMQ